MRAGARWLRAAFGRQAEGVAAAYCRRLDPAAAEGRLILADLARYCRAGRSSFVPGDPHQTAFNEGARDVFLHVAEMLRLSPHDFPALTEPSPTTEDER